MHLIELKGAVATIFVQISHIDLALMVNHWERKDSIRLPCLPVGTEQIFLKFIGLSEYDHGTMKETTPKEAA